MLAALILFSASVVRADAVLTITNAEMSPRFPNPGNQVTLRVTVKNIGEDAIPFRTSLGVEFYSSTRTGQRTGGESIQAIPMYTENIAPLEPNQTQVISATAKLNKRGFHTAFVILHHEALPMDKVRFENGSRNIIFEVSPPSDLALERIYLNHQGRLIIRMYNAGNKIPNEQYNNSNISVRAGGDQYLIPLRKAAPKTIQNAAKPGIPGVFTRHTFKWPMTGQSGFKLNPAEKTKVEVTVDYNQSINDAKQQNNTIKQELGGGPDLVVCFKKDNHNKPHRYATYYPEIKNIGYATAPPSRLRFWIEGKGASNYGVPKLEPGMSYKGGFRRVYWVNVGNRKFRLTADFAKAVNEFDEYNNIIEGVIMVGDYGFNSKTLCSDSPGMTGFN